MAVDGVQDVATGGDDDGVAAGIGVRRATAVSAPMLEDDSWADTLPIVQSGSPPPSTASGKGKDKGKDGEVVVGSARLPMMNGVWLTFEEHVLTLMEEQDVSRQVATLIAEAMAETGTPHRP